MALEDFSMVDLDDGEVKDVEVEFGVFPVKLEKRMHTYMGKYSASADLTTFGGDLATGNIGDLLISNVVKSLKIDGKDHKWNRAQSLWESLPNLVDEEKDESIADRLLKLAVKHNPRIGRHRKFAMVFSEFLPDEADKEDPTSGGSANASTGKLSAVPDFQTT